MPDILYPTLDSKCHAVVEVIMKREANGQPVSASNLQVGDLLFWGSESAPYHVAIYIGNNQYVNAATPEQGTILQTMTSYFAPTIVKRVL